MAYDATLTIPDKLSAQLLSSIAHERERSTVSVSQTKEGATIKITAQDEAAFRACLHSILQEMTIISKTAQLT